ncbi:Na+/solute symporter [Thermovirga lienii DSM 17291]|uniref:Na+/solute symporter n=1 Tax=Thermovirga lienii (strain ATCC BAA-1197 / DSM 17291 / Cas60314) TaxID=580340 RepID=G7V908_THELD|nr:sodium:solute symporter family protein [Thermovirga lienii]AER67542.1 Na+/solute symporter [Thermovirga lienii DSM 17291]
MEPKMVSFGLQMVVLVVLALVGMVFAGWYSYKKRVGTTIDDFFAAGKSLGFMVLALALFADAYSGNSFLGYAAKTYRSGAWFLVYPQFMVAALIGALIVAPPIINLGKKWGYVSPFDYIEHRFNSKLVALIALIFMAWGTFVQFAEQFFAMGYLGEVASGGVLPYQLIVITFAIVILIYVGLGGFRGTALTAAIQGAVMIFSLFVMLVLIEILGGFGNSINIAWQVAPKKLAIPSTATMVTWYSTIILILLGLPTYPHVLQFYMGARDIDNLKKTFRLKAPVFLFAALVLWLIGMFGVGIFPNLSKLESEKLVPYLVGALALSFPGGYTLGSIINLGVIMATLSTAGATVMVLSMILSKELYKRFINPDAPDDKVIAVSRISICILLVLALILAFNPSITIWRWTEIKFELLLQATSVLVFSLYLPRIKKNPTIAGMLIGGSAAVVLTLTGHSKVYGIHAGLVGFAINSLIVIVGSYITGENQETERAKGILKYATIEDTRNGEIKYMLPAQSKTFWFGLVIVIALMVPWYAPESWNARSALGIPIWTWVTIFALFVEMLFVIFATYLWRKD